MSSVDGGRQESTQTSPESPAIQDLAGVKDSNLGQDLDSPGQETEDAAVMRERESGLDEKNPTDRNITPEAAGDTHADKNSLDAATHAVEGAEETVATETPQPQDTGKEATPTDDHRVSTDVNSQVPPPPPPKDKPIANPPSQTTTTAEKQNPDKEWNEKEPYEPSGKAQPPDHEFDDRPREGDAPESKAEIQSIIQQFGDSQGHQSNVTSPTGSDLPVFQYPPRSSSLDPTISAAPTSPPHKTSSSAAAQDADNASLSRAPSIASQPPLPEPDPEPDLPFDFHRFLEQLRHRTADPVAKFLRSFLLEFGKKQWQVHEQVKIITDFLTFISTKMAQCDVWRSVSDAEFDNAREGMEKLVMNRLYNQTFSPEIPPVDPLRNKGRRSATPLGPGRKGQHQEDVERDEVLAQKVRIYGWIREEHLDIRPFAEKGKRFLQLAQQELSKIKSYRAPRDKVICVLNCCKVIFGYLRNAHSDQSADAFIPLLIYTVLKANPEHLVSNVQYILRFRNQDKLGGEAGYYMSSLLGAVQFIENLDRTNLTISDEEFEKNVEVAVSSIAEPHEQEEKIRRQQNPAHPAFTGKSAPSRAEVTPRHSMDAEQFSPRRPPAQPAEAGSGDEAEEKAAMAGLLRTIQKPLSTIGRIFSEETGGAGALQQQSAVQGPPSTPQPPSLPNMRPPRTSSMQQGGAVSALQAQQPPGAAALASREREMAEESAARQASAEAEQAHRVQQAEHRTVVE